MHFDTRWITCLYLVLAVGMLGGCRQKEDLSRDHLEGQLQSVLDDMARDPKIPGALIYLSSPAFGVWSGAAGLGDMETNRAMKPSSRFRAGSILKMFVSVVILQLVEDDRISLDAQISDLLAEDVSRRLGNTNQITVRMLLNHTGGIPECFSEGMDAEILADPHKIWQDNELLDIAMIQGSSVPPGEGWRYSNTHYLLLGKIIEKTTGHTWRKEVAGRVIEKLGLGDTFLPEPGEKAMPEHHARGYHLIDSRFVDMTEVDPSMAGAAGGHALVTTAEDLTRFLDALLAGQFFQNGNTLDEMLDFVDAPDEHEIPYFYGLGIEKYVLPGGFEIMGHAGSTAGFASIVYSLPSDRLTVSIATNTQDLESVYLQVLLPILDVLRPVLQL